MARPTLTVQLMLKQRELDAALFDLHQARMDLLAADREVAQLRAESEVCTTTTYVRTPEPVRPALRTQAQVLARILPEHFVKARELAMRTGRSVKVSA